MLLQHVCTAVSFKVQQRSLKSELSEGEGCSDTLQAGSCVMRKIRIYIWCQFVVTSEYRWTLLLFHMAPGNYLNNPTYSHSPFSVCLYRLPPGGGTHGLLSLIDEWIFIFVLLLSDFINFRHCMYMRWDCNDNEKKKTKQILLMLKSRLGSWGPWGSIKEPSVLVWCKIKNSVWCLQSWLDSGLYLRENRKFGTKIMLFFPSHSGRLFTTTNHSHFLNNSFIKTGSNNSFFFHGIL